MSGRKLGGALVTGAAQGLGAAIAAALHRAGFSVALTDVNTDAVAQTARRIAPDGDRIAAFALDVTRKSDFEAGLAKTVELFGGVNVLVNNAAMTPTTPVMEISPEEFDRVVAINQRGTFFGCQVFGAHFAAQNYGRIVNMASLAGQNGGTAAGAHYAASKGAILTLTKIFARQLAGAGVTVNAVAPGPMDLPSVRDLGAAGKAGADHRHDDTGQNPRRRRFRRRHCRASHGARRRIRHRRGLGYQRRHFHALRTVVE